MSVLQIVSKKVSNLTNYFSKLEEKSTVVILIFQPSIATFAPSQLGDGHFQLAGAFQHVYPAVASTSGYDRMSPVDEFPGSSHNSETLQQLQRLTSDGSRIIQVAQMPDQRGLVTVSIRT